MISQFFFSLSFFLCVFAPPPPKKDLFADSGLCFSILREEGRTDVFSNRRWWSPSSDEEESESDEEGREDQDDDDEDLLY